MPVRPLPFPANLEHLKHQAKDLMRSRAARAAATAQVIREFHPRFAGAADAEIFAAAFKLSDAQLVVARERGFASWARLKRHIEAPTVADRLNLPHHERIEDAEFRRAVDLLDAGDAEELRAWLERHPGLVRRRVVFEGGNYFREPSLLEFVAENPIRHGRLSANMVEVARVILEAGADGAAKNAALGLVASAAVARECGVQVPLIELLCAHGAEPEGALRVAAVHGEWAAAEALVQLGARMDLAVAAALGRADAFAGLLAGTNAEERLLAVGLAAQFGHLAIVRVLLDEGVNPDRYIVGGHSHSTPLHQAALAGHMEVVRMLVERGARLDIKDVMWGGTAADWATHGGKAEVAVYLREEEKRRAV